MKHTIEICIPAFNEERVIAEAAGSVLRVLRGSGLEWALTVVDNGSTDSTAAVAKSVNGVTVKTISVRGKGAAVVAAAKESEAGIFGFIDADLSADPDQIIALKSFIEQGECDIAIGSRLLNGAKVDREMLRTFLSKMFNNVRKSMVGISIEDTQCGLKLMNDRGRRILAECKETGWFFDVEFLARAERAGLRIKEVPVRWDEHRFKDRKSKLVLMRDSLEAMRAFARIRRSLQ